MEKLDEIATRLAKATPGQWTAVIDEPVERGGTRTFICAPSKQFVLIGEKDDVLLAAHAPADLAYLLRRLKVAEEQIEYMANTAHQAYHHSDGNDARGWRECTRPFCKSAVEVLTAWREARG